MFEAISRLVKGFVKRSQAKQDIDFDIRCDKLAEALYHCGIPLWICRRNAKAFMTLRPEFDLDSPKHRRIKALLEYHQDEFLNAYFTVAQQGGKKAADKWAKYIRENDIFFARITSFADDLSAKFLFGC